MHRIDHSTATPANLFTKGDPQSGIPATVPTDDWANAVQEELCDIIEFAGITLVKGTWTQLREALIMRFDWWRLEVNTVTYIDPSSFKVVGNMTAVYEDYRALKLTQTSNAIGYVLGTSYHAGNDETTITVGGCTVDSGLSAIEYGQPVKNEPYNTRTIPVGACLDWPGETPPPGWLERNGAAISRTTYADLFQVLGCQYGKGDGSTTFNLPDDRGLFIRGWNHGAGVDPNAADRTSPFTAFTQTGDTANGSPVITNLAGTDNLLVGFTVTGAGIPTDTEILSIDSASQITLTQNATAAAVGVTLNFELIGDHVGTEQEDNIKSHRHSIFVHYPPDSGGGNYVSGLGTHGSASEISGDSGWVGGDETRPINRYYMPIIKY